MLHCNCISNTIHCFFLYVDICVELMCLRTGTVLSKHDLPLHVKMDTSLVLSRASHFKGMFFFVIV